MRRVSDGLGVEKTTYSTFQGTLDGSVKLDLCAALVVSSVFYYQLGVDDGSSDA